MKIAIWGIGNMGEWLAKALSKDNEVAVYDIDSKKMRDIQKDTLIKLLYQKEDLTKYSPDLFINAVSLSNTIEVFNEVIEYLKPHCILCDITSIKGNLPDFYKSKNFKYTSIHPMFGPTFSNLDSLKQENAVIIKESCEKGKNFFRRFFKGLGLTIFEYSVEEHDEMMAYSLSLPFVSSMVFAACMKNEVVPGSTFAKHKKIAQGLLSEDDRLLSEILFNKHTITQLEKVTSRLEFLKHVIRGRDYEEAKRFYDKLRENMR